MASEFALPRFAANLSLMFNEVGCMGRFERAARAGFAGVQFLFPYAHDVQEIAKQFEGHALELAFSNACRQGRPNVRTPV